MKKPTIFDYQAQINLTKHMGGMEATKKLIEECSIDDASEVLELGCGVGASSVYLAKVHGCQVTGLDISERMIQRARERAQANKVEHLTTFRTADINQLPFASNRFDVTFCESVLAFAQDKAKVIREMARVTRQGGFVALNESTWLVEPDDEQEAWCAQDMAANASTLTFDAWVDLLESAELKMQYKQRGRLEIKNEARGIIQRYGWIGLLQSVLRGILMYFQRSDYREFVAETRKSGVAPGNPEEYLGYGILIAKKS